MYFYSTASTSNAAYFIGGYDSKDVIAEFKNGAWRQLATLKRGRWQHGSISLDGETMVIGGQLSYPETEIWNFTNENYKTINLTLPNFHYFDSLKFGIALYIVPPISAPLKICVMKSQ